MKKVLTNMKSKTGKKRAVKGVLTATLVLGISTAVEAKDTKGIIMTVDGEEIPTEEFMYLYQKNNQQQETPQTIDEYLQLFEIYRLKVAEAKSEGVDTTTGFQKEMNQYRRELLEPYMADTAFINSLVQIAAEREKTEVESSHIMIIRTNNPEVDARNLRLLDSLRVELLNGADFIEMAKKYSQDRFSKDKGGYLGYTPAGTFPYGFETAEYDTPEGEISDIVESHVGWHIVKSGARKPAEEFNRPVKSYDEVKADVLRKISSPFDVRYRQIRERQLSNLKEKYKNQPSLYEGLSDEEAFENLLQAEQAFQYANNAEYRNLVDEYVNGSLLYEVSVINVWDKASKDDEGLQNYYERNKDKYTWTEPHAKGLLVQTANDSISSVIKQQIADLPLKDVSTLIKQNYKKEAQADRFNVARGNNPIIDYLMFGGEQVEPKGANYKDMFVVGARIIEEPEELSDVRSLVIVDYQEELENQWVDNLRSKHSVDINSKELSRIKKFNK